MNALFLSILFVIINGRWYSISPLMPDDSGIRIPGQDNNVLNTFTVQNNIILAHSNLAGQVFYQLTPGEDITIITETSTEIVTVIAIHPIQRDGYYFYETEVAGPLYLATCFRENYGIGNLLGMLLVDLLPHSNLRKVPL